MSADSAVTGTPALRRPLAGAVADAQAGILAIASTDPERDWRPSELRGGTGPVWTAAVADLINRRVLVFGSGRTVRLADARAAERLS